MAQLTCCNYHSTGGHTELSCGGDKATQPGACSLLRWDDTDRYEPGFKIGSQGDDGEHLRDAEAGWPYSIYRKADQIGVSDFVICHGIQNLSDAKEILDRLQCLA